MSGSLTGAVPALRTAYDGLTSALAAVGIVVGVADYGGFRTEADTATILRYRQNDYAAAVDSGAIAPTVTLDQFRPIAPYGQSYHDYGAAFDLAIQQKPDGWTDAQVWDEAGFLASVYGLRWGGTFANPDVDHFELAETLAEAEANYQDYLAAGGARPGSVDVAALGIVAALAAGIVLYRVLLSRR